MAGRDATFKIRDDGFIQDLSRKGQNISWEEMELIWDNSNYDWDEVVFIFDIFDLQRITIIKLIIIKW